MFCQNVNRINLCFCPNEFLSRRIFVQMRICPNEVCPNEVCPNVFCPAVTSRFGVAVEGYLQWIRTSLPRKEAYDKVRKAVEFLNHDAAYDVQVHRYHFFASKVVVAKGHNTRHVSRYASFSRPIQSCLMR